MLDNNIRSLSHDVAFDLLRNTRRRFVLRRLQEGPDGVELGDLSTELAAMENGVPVEELSRKDRKRIYVSLYQTHIPKLEDSGVVTYDPDTGVVHPTERLDELTAYFEEESWFDVGIPLYLIAPVAGIALYGIATAIGVPVTDPIHLGVGILGVITILGLVKHAFVDRVDARRPAIPVDGDET